MIEAERIFIIATLPDAEERKKLSERLGGAEIIEMEASEEECIERAMNDNERTDKHRQIEIIQKWFAKNKKSKNSIIKNR